MIVNNGDSVDRIIAGFGGREIFCKECELNETCTNKDVLPKVLRSCKDAIEFYFANQKYQNFVWQGSYRDQPLWLMDMSNIVGTTIAEMKKDGN